MTGMPKPFVERPSNVREGVETPYSRYADERALVPPVEYVDMSIEDTADMRDVAPRVVGLMALVGADISPVA
jgi:hypothetical protein